jgi:polar amino acid transport system ATP-binding protein
MISIRHLKKVYPNATPLLDVNVEINRGDVVSIIGPSGTGKSTLLRCINLLECPTSGEVLIDGKSITARGANVPAIRRKMGMVFQSFNLFNHLTIIENIMVAQMDILHRSKQDACAKGMELLHRVGLADKADNLPEELSGGQKQRVAIARTLAMDPEIILLDEPTSALDPTMIGEVLTVIKDLSNQGLTMMIVTHEMKFARDISTRVFYMDEGVIYEEGTSKQIFENPQREKTRLFIKHLKVFDEHLVVGNIDFMGVMNRFLFFAEKNQMENRTIRNVSYVLDEMVMLGLVPKLPQGTDIRLMAEYSEDNSRAEIRLEFAGPNVNPLDCCDEISRQLIDVATEHYEQNVVNGLTVIHFHVK